MLGGALSEKAAHAAGILYAFGCLKRASGATSDTKLTRSSNPKMVNSYKEVKNQPVINENEKHKAP
jgi:hypothetical protein